MRIRKRLPAPVEASVKPSSGEERCDLPGDQHGETLRHSGGSLESSRSISEVKDVPRDASERSNRSQGLESEEGETGNGNKKQEQTSCGDNESLMRSLIVVFERAGDGGLTAREAVSKLVEYNLPGLQRNSSDRSSVQVAKVLRTPTFARLEAGKYFLHPSMFKSVVAESSAQCELSQQQAILQRREEGGNVPVFTSGRRKRAGVVAMGRASQTPDASEVKVKLFPDENALQVSDKVEFKKRRRRPPSSQHELAIGVTQCKRYDGRGWQCTRETEEGFSFCEHHQALMNKRALRLNLAKIRRSGAVNEEMQHKAVDRTRGNPKSVLGKPDGSLNLVQYERGRMVKARSLRSIK